ncbi:MAG: carboxylating nicotinate-nucleotide diphosphorylase [Myxococcales bacterium]|nr:carboxylating nicotinate-nucleotide diphosphorylase [Myxococcales bacterium]
MPWNSPHTRGLIDLALEEDLGRGDVTSVVSVPAEIGARAQLVAREPLVVAALPLAALVFERVEPQVRFCGLVAEGDRAEAGTVLASVEGTARGVLAAERTALNFLQRLCGVATQTARFVAAVEGTRAQVTDTRKTTPGYRALEKYAVRVAGGRNHRFDLGSGVLIKDNHVAAVGSVAAAVHAARKQAPHGLKIEVEVDTLAQFDEALEAEADIVLLDNFTRTDILVAVERRNARGRSVPLLEVSGGVTLATVRSFAETGVDLVSVGALTHAARAVDIALDFLPS